MSGVTYSAERTRAWRRRNGVPERARIPEGVAVCPVDGCERTDLRAPHGYCGMHHQRWVKRGDVNWQRPRGYPPDRFWSKVDFAGESGCWVWVGKTNPDGYGRFFVDRDHRQAPAHRWSYEFCVGPIPEGLVIDHLCRNPGCVNPDHLEPVTHAENIRRAYR